MATVVHGLGLDPATRCIHYHGPLDVVAIKMYCCQMYFACISCHESLADHTSKPWPVNLRDAVAVMCGACQHQMTIQTYLDNDQCSQCGAPFNPRCSLHYPLYFEMI